MYTSVCVKMSKAIVKQYVGLRILVRLRAGVEAEEVLWQSRNWSTTVSYTHLKVVDLGHVNPL